MASTFYLILAIIAIYWIKTPIEKVVATYITLDILGIFIINGILTHYKVIYLKKYYNIKDFLLKEGINYIIIGLLTYGIMFFLTNYDKSSIGVNIFNVIAIIVLSILWLLELRRLRMIYYPLISNKYTKTEDFEKMYLFNNHQGLKIEYEYWYGSFTLKSIEKGGIKVEKDFIYMGGVRYIRSQYFRYMKENEIKTLEDLTEEDKLLIAMININ